MNRLTLATASILIGCAVCSAGDDPKATFDSLFADRISAVEKTRSLDDDVALAGEMLNLSREIVEAEATDILEHFYEAVYRLASKSPRGYPAAIEAMERMAGRFPRRARDATANTVKIREAEYKTARGSSRKAVAASLIEAICQRADAELRDLDAREAMNSYRRAMGIDTSNGGAYRDALRAQMAYAADAQRALNDVDKLLQQFRQSPDDAELARMIVDIYLIKLDHPERATPYTDGLDEQTRRNVEMATREVDLLLTGDQAALGIWYADLAEREGDLVRLKLLKRASTYLEAALSRADLEGLTKIVAEKRFESVISAIEAAPDLGGDRPKWKSLFLLPNRLVGWKLPEAFADGESILYANGVLDVTSQRGHASATYTTDASHLVVAAEMRLLDGRQVKIILRSSDKGSYQAIYHGKGRFSIGVFDAENDRWREPEEKKVQLPENQTFMSVKFAAIGKALIVFVNGEAIMRHEDELLESGSIRLTTFEGRGQFRNVRLLQPTRLEMKQILSGKPPED